MRRRKGGREVRKEVGRKGSVKERSDTGTGRSTGRMATSLPPSLPPSHPPDRSLTRLSSRYKQACFRTFSKKRDAPEKKAGEHFK